MTLIAEKLREKIYADLTVINEDELAIISEFIDTIKESKLEAKKELNNNNIKETKSDKEIRFTPTSGKGYLEYAGKWVGEDLQDCLKAVYENRGKVKVNNRINPFK